MNLIVVRDTIVVDRRGGGGGGGGGCKQTLRVCCGSVARNPNRYILDGGDRGYDRGGDRGYDGV
jgi:hypothetical protein